LSPSSLIFLLKALGSAFLGQKQEHTKSLDFL